MSNVESRAKYRGYEPESNCWVVGNLINNDGIMIIHTSVGDYYISNVNTIGQYTGRLDTDEKEIFEGDILICVNQHTYISKMGLVIWNENKLAFEVIDIGGNIIQNIWADYDLKIAGNKYFDFNLLYHNFNN